jgi:hypothetical protein
MIALEVVSLCKISWQPFRASAGWMIRFMQWNGLFLCRTFTQKFSMWIVAGNKSTFEVKWEMQMKTFVLWYASNSIINVNGSASVVVKTTGWWDTRCYSLKEIFMHHNIYDTVAKGNGQMARYSVEEGIQCLFWILFGLPPETSHLIVPGGMSCQFHVLGVVVECT